ncbi:MAG: hypothetical protein A2161_17205 [Candidatus Schekmanbacteria bacterium RBG_13_48_7]|uniref:Uncharacterized protein n=1 Tax=Candidatus Schekmanbacteria bacterium RBG_13_48_7 TaxID=1817878 RepID=A0A1F7S2Y4_9BACT|nr:MAG: hypothetical protein A2161_17205 [Candidatus Schekmanbacteria bacterium RBG_13_48_7]
MAGWSISRSTGTETDAGAVFLSITRFSRSQRFPEEQQIARFGTPLPFLSACSSGVDEATGLISGDGLWLRELWPGYD